MSQRNRGRHDYYRNTSDFARGHLNIDWQVRQAVESLHRKGEHVVVAAKQALEECALIIRTDMENRVPIKTGRLQRSIQYDVLEDGAVIEFSANARNPKDNFLYGPIVEFSEWHMWKGKRRKKKKKAFMYPAFDEHYAEVRQILKQAIDTAIARGH